MKKQIETVAILVDGSYFLKRYSVLLDPLQTHSPERVAKALNSFALAHVGNNHLYRIFYYDCFPFTGKANNPITKKAIDFKKTRQYRFRTALLEELKKKRKIALRMGILKNTRHWSLKPGLAKDLIDRKVRIEDIRDIDVSYDLRQKGIDMKIGIDIASLAFKKLVTQIVLIAGDSDFIPASKLARKEGIDFILDPMWNLVDHSLLEHIDGLRSTCPKPKNFTAMKVFP